MRLPYPVGVKSKDYELIVREIYQQMLDQDKALNVVVQHNVHKQGLVTNHQIDVYWEFRLGGVVHRVIVQAKNWTSPIRKGDVYTFKGVLEDLPGTVGIMVTASRYQKGALDVAKAAGIIICDLREETAVAAAFYPGETVKFTIKGFLRATDGSHLGFLVETARKIPELSDLKFKADTVWQKANDPLPARMELTADSSNIQLCDQDGRELITITKILGEFYAEMHRDGEMKATKTHKFQQPTFLRLSNPPLTIKEESFSATIMFRPEVTTQVWKAPNVASFILKNLTDDTVHRFVVKKT